MTEIWHAILSTNTAPPQVGTRCLIAMPTPHTNPYGIGLILSVVRRPGGHMPTWDLQIEVVDDDDEAVKLSHPRGSNPIDCYRTVDEADRWHAVDFAHFARHGYGRNHWPE